MNKLFKNFKKDSIISYLLRNWPIYPVWDQGLRGHPFGVELVGDILLPEPDQNQPKIRHIIL